MQPSPPRPPANGRRARRQVRNTARPSIQLRRLRDPDPSPYNSGARGNELSLKQEVSREGLKGYEGHFVRIPSPPSTPSRDTCRPAGARHAGTSGNIPDPTTQNFSPPANNLRHNPVNGGSGNSPTQPDSLTRSSRSTRSEITSGSALSASSALKVFFRFAAELSSP